MSSRREYMADYMLRRYHKRRAKFVAEWGGKCVDCGSTDSLEFDHKDASTKEHEVGKMFTSASEAKLRAELEKCVLRCTSCHADKSRSEDWGVVGHGEGKTGKRNCKCGPCKAKKAEYMRNYKKRGSQV